MDRATLTREETMSDMYKDPKTGRLYNNVAEAYADGVDIRSLETVSDSAPAPAPEPEPVKAADRIAEDVAFLEGKGWTAEIPSTWFAAGTEMMEIGKRTFRSKAKTHADLPPLREAFQPVIQAIQAEDRKSYMVDASTLRMTPDGKIHTAGRPASGAVPIEPEAVWQLLSRFNSGTSPKSPAFPSARPLLQAIDGDLRAEIFNRQISRLEALGYDETSRGVNIGTRVINGSRQIFRAMSRSYLDMPVSSILEQYLQVFEDYAGQLPDARGVVDYNPATTMATWSATWHAPATFDAAVGDVFEVGIKGRSGDTGNSAHHGGLSFTRILCVNCTIADWIADGVNRRHRGSRVRTAAAARAAGLERVRKDVLRTAAGLGEAAEYFLDRWGILRTRSAGDVVDMTTPETAMAGAHKILAGLDKEASRDVTVEMLLQGYKFEGGDRLADVVNAVSRAASHGMLDAIQRDRAERAAGAFMLAVADKAA